VVDIRDAEHVRDSKNQRLDNEQLFIGYGKLDTKFENRERFVTVSKQCKTIDL
jgi:hypothetical protein